MAVPVTKQRARKAMATVDQVYLLEKGRIVLDGESAAVAEDPRAVQVYLGACPGPGLNLKLIWVTVHLRSLR